MQVESDELHEFEMLEEAANMSFSSQLSLFNDPPRCLPTHQPVTNLASVGATKASAMPSKVVEEQRLTVYHSESDDTDEHNSSGDLDETLKFSPSLAKGVEFNDEEAWESFNHGSPQSRHRTESSGSDITLSHPSPSGRGEIWSSPVKKEVLGMATGFTSLHQATLQRDVARTRALKSSPTNGDYITAVEKHRVPEVPCSANVHPLTSSQAPESTELSPYHRHHHHQPHQQQQQQHSHHTGNPHFHTESPHFHTAEPHSSSSSIDGVVSAQDSLPPPSALVSKLFPVLRAKEQPNIKPRSVSDSHIPLYKSPSPTSSTEDSGIRSLSSSTSVALNEDLKYKLTQLEEEIARYRSENASLEKLRREREEVSVRFLNSHS
jgi:hypothetical protein